MSTPKREKRPPKRYADSPVLLVNKKKKEQKVKSQMLLILLMYIKTEFQEITSIQDLYHTVFDDLENSRSRFKV